MGAGMLIAKEVNRLATLHFISLVNTFICENGFSSPPLLEGSGLTTADIKCGTGVITPDQEFTILRNAITITGNTHLGLYLGEHCRLGSFGIFGFTLLSSQSLRTALSLLFQYPLPFGTGYQLELTEQHGLATLIIKENFTIEESLRLLAVEFCIKALHRLMGDLLCMDFPLTVVNIGRETIHPSARYKEHFNCPVLVKTSRLAISSLVFDAKWLDTPLPWAHSVGHEDMKIRSAKLTSVLEMPNGLLDEIRMHIIAHIHKAPSLESIAYLMNCSSKTLQRFLQGEGTSFVILLKELRFIRVKEMLDEKMSISSISECLGFSDTAYFRRAFKRWSGFTPSQYPNKNN